MKSIHLQDFPQWSEWPARLLGRTERKTPNRTVEKIDSEYDKDKYLSCLTFLDARSQAATPEDVKRFEFGAAPDTPICVSLGNDLYELPLQEARARYYALLIENLSPAIQAARSVVELGAGYGYNLWLLRERFKDKAFAGGEYSENATKVAGKLYSKEAGIHVERFNFYAPETYE